MNYYKDHSTELETHISDDGKVKYQRRFLNSDAYKAAMKNKVPIFSEFGTGSLPDPCKNIFQRCDMLIYTMFDTIIPCSIVVFINFFSFLQNSMVLNTFQAYLQVLVRKICTTYANISKEF